MKIHVEYEAGEHYSENFVIMVAKAASQLGINYQLTFRDKIVRAKTSDGRVDSHYRRLPVVRFEEKHKEAIERRAIFLHGRSERYLPVDPLPDGSWPDSEDEYTDPIVLNVATDEDRRAVVLDLGRPLRAMTIHPSAARSLAMWIMATANQIGGELAEDESVKTRVAYVTEPEGKSVKQASLEFRDFFMSDSSQTDEG